LSITAAGVRTGASNPNHRYGGNPPYPLSPIVGTSGSSEHRTSLVISQIRFCKRGSSISASLTCQSRPDAPQQKASLFDHLVGESG
jgi:hypothetical protein